MLELPGVTLVCVDTANHALALRAIARSTAGVRFARVAFCTDGLPAGLILPPGVELVRIRPLASRDAYSRFMLKELAAQVTTPHALVIQWDGYVVNPDAWDPAFLGCDYLGARWSWHDDGMRVGNGGFSLRSKRLLDALADPRIELVDAEDATICRTFRPLLEREHGVVFGSEALADRFSYEAAYPIGRPFGFHGLFNFCRVVPAAELALLAPTFSDAIARSPQAVALLRNCLALGQWPAAAALARRIVGVRPDDPEALALAAVAERNAAAPPTAGRNDPCPCGSGKKFKHCHGALGAARSDASPAISGADGAAGGSAAATGPAPPVSAPRPPPVPPPVSPPSADALARAGVDAHRRGDLAAAERDYRAALALAPGHPLATHYLGVVEYQRGRLDAALPLLERAVAALPGEPEFHNNLGLALAAADRVDEAIAAYRRALDLKPDHAVAWNNLGLALQADNRLEDAIAAFGEARRRAPAFTEARWNLALALLASGRFDEGWRDYDARLELPQLGALPQRPPSPRWDGVPRAGTTLLLIAEQGLGDAIQFVRFAAPLAAAGLDVVVRAPPPLVSLFARVPGVRAAVASDAPWPAHDVHLPLLSVAGALRVTGATIPRDVPYLRVDPARRAEAVATIAARDENSATAAPGTARRLNVGLAWAGNPRNVNDRRRSIDAAHLAPLLDLRGIAWYSLQRDSDEGAMRELPAAASLSRLPLRNDFEGMAALVSALDLVVSVDTSIAHLSGALARPTWVLLPYAFDWRWQQGRADSPWYPTLRLFRQPTRGDWDGVVAAVRDALASLVAAR
jgi:Flp pilus assembly protein TadD